MSVSSWAAGCRGAGLRRCTHLHRTRPPEGDFYGAIMVISEHKFFHVPNIVEGSHSALCLLLHWVLGRSVLGICHIPRRRGGGSPIKVSSTCWCWLATLKQRADEIALAKLVANEGRTSGARICLYLFVLSLLGRQKRKCHSEYKSWHSNKGLTSGCDFGLHVCGISWGLSPKF